MDTGTEYASGAGMGGDEEYYVWKEGKEKIENILDVDGWGRKLERNRGVERDEETEAGG